MFAGLEISKDKNLCEEYFGKYPVISLNLKDIDGSDYEASCIALKKTIEKETRRLNNRYGLLDGDRLSEDEKDVLNDILFNRFERGVAGSVGALTQILHKQCGKNSIVLIDEYDVPLDKAYQNGYYDQMMSMIRNLLSNVLKSNDYLKFAVLTGCLRIAKESIFTGLNNFVVNAISDEEYSKYFGFTEAEVLQMLEYYGLERYKDIIKEWYDGYKFGDTWVYCPWDVLNYLRKIKRSPNAKPEAFWVNSSSNSIIRNILSGATETTKEQLELLISGETIEKKLMLELTYKDLDYSDVELREIYLWSVMYATGYITEVARLENGTSILKIPNREVWEIYNEKIKGWFNESIRGDMDRLAKFCRAIKSGDVANIQSIFNDCMSGCISIRDTYVRKEMKENFYHGMLLGILQCEGSWVVKSNQESGIGYGDIFLTSPKDKIGCVIEVKYAEEGTFEKAGKDALQQIEQNQYIDFFKEKGMKEIHAYGIACYKKECGVTHKKICI